MTYYDYLCRLLEPMRVYRTERGTLSGGELYAAGKALDKADGAMEYAEQEGLTEQMKAENQMEWVQRMNNIRERVNEVVNTEMIFT